MSLFKSAQILDAKDEITDLANEDQVILFDAPAENDNDMVEMHGEPSGHVGFHLGKLPGSDVEDLEVSTDEPLVVEDKKEAPKALEVKDPWDWQSDGLERFMEWVSNRCNSIPRHRGETAGIERAIAYLKKLNNELSKAVSSDYDGKIDIEKLEMARREIYSGIERLEDAKDKMDEARSSKRRKAAKAEKAELIKEAQKTTSVGGIIVTVPLLISSIARTCINSTVSAGKDIEKVADELIDKYKLNDREQMELIQLISDMGYPVRRPRGYNRDEKIDPTSVDNFDWMPNYYA
jgi:hypothetical protein